MSGSPIMGSSMHNRTAKVQEARSVALLNFEQMSANVSWIGPHTSIVRLKENWLWSDQWGRVEGELSARRPL